MSREHPHLAGVWGGRFPLLVAAIALLLVVVSRPAYGQGQTARAGLSKAAPLAKSWKADAALSGVTSTAVKPDGSAIVWQYSYQSASSRKCFRIVVVSTGAINSTDLGTCTLGTALASDFVDSPSAIMSATAAGFKPGDADNNMQLLHKQDHMLTPARACWVVYTYDSDFDRANGIIRGWCVNPKTGKFDVRLAGKT